VNIDWSFPKRVLLALFVMCGIGAYPVIVYGGERVLVASVSGALLATINVLVGYAAIEYSFGKSATTFFKYVMGGMGLRLLFLAIALVLLIKVFRMHTGALVGSMGIFYMVFLALELLFIQKKVSIKQQQ
jgi:hypothetical protein